MRTPAFSGLTVACAPDGRMPRVSCTRRVFCTCIRPYQFRPVRAGLRVQITRRVIGRSPVEFTVARLHPPTRPKDNR